MSVSVVSQYVFSFTVNSKLASGNQVLLSTSFPSITAFIFLTGIDLWKGKYVMVMFPVSLRRPEPIILKSRTDALAAYFPF